MKFFEKHPKFFKVLENIVDNGDLIFNGIQCVIVYLLFMAFYLFVVYSVFQNGGTIDTLKFKVFTVIYTVILIWITSAHAAKPTLDSYRFDKLAEIKGKA